ncbi:MAG TPA: putative peptidoglycan glycosyltransferase FtsW [Anaerolineales bacterium]|nr:putative peptidoglycan glycosyltransferase FtsW [Anaerolineales bacterium]
MTELTAPPPSSAVQRPPRSAPTRPWGFDPWLLILVGIMIVFGLVMVYSSSWDVSYRLFGNPNALILRQLGNLGFGLIAMVAAALFPIRYLRKLATPIILTTIFVLFVLLLVSAGSGPRRAFLAGSVQPSELAKLAVIIYLAVWMESKGERLSEWGYGFVPLMTIIGIVGGLILLQPDLSAVLTVASVALVMFYLAGAKLSQSAVVTGGSAIVGYVLVRLTNTGRARWADYVAGLVNIQEASYHVQQSLQSFFSGGLLGRGLGASREKFGLLPAPHTDSIFAVVGEELGLIGALLVLTLFAFLMWRSFRIASEAPDRLGMLLAGGVAFWIGIEALINMSVLLGLLPFAGNALPFFSYGGSNLVVTLAGVGLLLNVSRRQPTAPSTEGYVSTIGVGWRHRRRRVSRLGHHRRARPEG